MADPKYSLENKDGAAATETVAQKRVRLAQEIKELEDSIAKKQARLDEINAILAKRKAEREAKALGNVATEEKEKPIPDAEEAKPTEILEGNTPALVVAEKEVVIPTIAEEGKVEASVIEKAETKPVVENKTEEIIEVSPAVQKQEQAIVDSLTKEEKEMVVEEMKTATVLPFEPKPTEKTIGTFLRNTIVKGVMGIKESKAMAGIRRKAILGVMAGTMFISMFSGKSEDTKLYMPDDVKATILALDLGDTTNSEKNFQIDEYEKLPDFAKAAYLQSRQVENMDMETFNQLPSENARNVYLYNVAHPTDTAYIMVDKPTATMFVIDKNNKLAGTLPVLVGQTKGEAPNMSDPNSDRAEHATTPAGKYHIGEGELDEDLLKQYKGRIYSIYGSHNLAVHMAYPGEYAKRMAALNSPKQGNNRNLSWGCINVTPDSFDKLIKPYFMENMTLYVLPDDYTLYALNPKTGNLESTGNALYTSNWTPRGNGNQL